MESNDLIIHIYTPNLLSEKNVIALKEIIAKKFPRAKIHVISNAMYYYISVQSQTPEIESAIAYLIDSLVGCQA